MKGTPVLMANNPFKNIATGLALATMPIVTPIQNIQVDDMVKAYHHEEFLLTASNDVDNIYVHGWRSYDYLDITPETWQIGKFIIKEKNGNIVEIEANRPKEWFENYGLCKKGDKAFITIAEMTIFDYVTLVSTYPTKIDTRKLRLDGNGKVNRPVITKYKRVAKEISDYTFSNGQVIGATPNHPFYSLDREEYVPIGELEFGEKILTAGEREVKFISGKSRERRERMFITLRFGENIITL